MATAAKSAAIDESHISEILKLAHDMLQRYRDQDLADKTLTVQEYLEMSRVHPEWDYRDLLANAHADLVGAVHLRLNVELAVAGAQLLNLSSSHAGRA